MTPLTNILQRLRSMPMLTVVVLVAVGIIVADGLQMGVWTAAAMFIVATAAAVVRREAVAIMVIMAGALTISLRREAEQPIAEAQLLKVELLTLAHDLPSRVDFNAKITASFGEKGWQRRAAEVRVSAHPALGLQVGERIVTRARVRPYDEETSYGGYMLRVGRVGTIWLDSTKIHRRERCAPSFGERLRAKAMQRIEALRLSPETRPVVAAISIGERSTLKSDLRQTYVRAGGAHLLAVSGLHVGFLFVVVNLLLLPLIALRHGQILRSAAAIVTIWLYVAMAGASPSVVRAAIMFTLTQLMLTVASRNKSLNTLCLAATLMLVWDGRMIYDAGFLMSVLSVAAIIAWGVPLSRALRLSRLLRWDDKQNYSRWRKWVERMWNSATATIVVSFVASAVTMPLAAHLFGEVSLWSVVVGGVMVALCAVAMCVTMLWILLPIAPLVGVVSWVVEHSTGAMNAIAEWCAHSSVMSHQLSISLASCLMIYLAYALLTLALWSYSKEG